MEPAAPDLAGLTVVGEVVRGTLVKPGAPQAVGAREFPWLTDGLAFQAEHFMTLTPCADGSTELVHTEDSDGRVAEERWPGILVGRLDLRYRIKVGVRTASWCIPCSSRTHWKLPRLDKRKNQNSTQHTHF